MATKHRSILQSFWEDARTWTRDMRDVFLFVTTCESSQVCGLFRVSPQTIADYTGIETTEAVEEALRQLSVAGYLIFEENTIFIRKYAERQNSSRLTGFPEHVRNQALRVLSWNGPGRAFIRKYANLILQDRDFYEILFERFGEDLVTEIEAVPTVVKEYSPIDPVTGNSDLARGTSRPPLNTRVEYFLDLLPKELAEKPGFEEAWIAWVDYRATTKFDGKVRPMTDRSAKALIRNLQMLRDPVHAIYHSIAHEWRGIYADQRHEQDVGQESRTREREMGVERERQLRRREQEMREGGREGDGTMSAETRALLDSVLGRMKPDTVAAVANEAPLRPATAAPPLDPETEQQLREAQAEALRRIQ